MSSAQDPFYIVKEEIQEPIDRLQTTLNLWDQTPSSTGEHVHLTKELLASYESIEWQIDELDKAIAVAARDPTWYGLDDAELEKRRRWTSTAHNQFWVLLYEYKWRKGAFHLSKAKESTLLKKQKQAS